MEDRVYGYYLDQNNYDTHIVFLCGVHMYDEMPRAPSIRLLCGGQSQWPYTTMEIKLIYKFSHKDFEHSLKTPLGVDGHVWTEGTVCQNMAEEIDLPVIDFSSPDRLKKAQEIVRAMETVGFLFLDKVPGHDERELRKWVDWFWSLSKEKKMKIARKRYNPMNKHVRIMSRSRSELSL